MQIEKKELEEILDICKPFFSEEELEYLDSFENTIILKETIFQKMKFILERRADFKQLWIKNFLSKGEANVILS